MTQLEGFDGADEERASTSGMDLSGGLGWWDTRDEDGGCVERCEGGFC